MIKNSDVIVYRKQKHPINNHVCNFDGIHLLEHDIPVYKDFLGNTEMGKARLYKKDDCIFAKIKLNEARVKLMGVENGRYYPSIRISYKKERDIEKGEKFHIIKNSVVHSLHFTKAPNIDHRIKPIGLLGD